MIPQEQRESPLSPNLVEREKGKGARLFWDAFPPSIPPRARTHDANETISRLQGGMPTGENSLPPTSDSI